MSEKTEIIDKTEFDDATSLDFTRTELGAELTRTSFDDKTELDDSTVFADVTEYEKTAVGFTEVDATIRDTTELADKTEFVDRTQLDDKTALEFEKSRKSITRLSKMNFGSKKKNPDNLKFVPRTTPLREVANYVAEKVPMLRKYATKENEITAASDKMYKILIVCGALWLVSLIGVVLL
jgi:hypothetical protein